MWSRRRKPFQRKNLSLPRFLTLTFTWKCVSIIWNMTEINWAKRHPFSQSEMQVKISTPPSPIWDNLPWSYFSLVCAKNCLIVCSMREKSHFCAGNSQTLTRFAWVSQCLQLKLGAISLPNQHNFSCKEFLTNLSNLLRKKMSRGLVNLNSYASLWTICVNSSHKFLFARKSGRM